MPIADVTPIGPLSVPDEGLAQRLADARVTSGLAVAAAVARVRPATTMVEVRALIEPWMRVEIEADAVVG